MRYSRGFGVFVALGVGIACGGGGSGGAGGSTDAGPDSTSQGDTGTASSSSGGGSDSGMPDDSSAGHDGGPATDGGKDGSVDGATARDGSTTDGGVVLGQPITATPGQWTWIDFPDTTCGDGSTTGLGVNLSTTSSGAVIYLEGGGACWDELTCYSIMSAANFTTGYSQSQFASESTSASYLALPGGFFDRTAAANPFKDCSYVYVPYCTGDIFAGDAVTTLGTHTAHFKGFANMTAYLQRVVPTFSSADRVFLVGSSAGGMGAAWNWWQTQQLFGSVRVDLIDDSGTFMPADIPISGLTAQNAAWGTTATAPPGCTACATDRSTLYSLVATSSPRHSGALLSYDPDSTLPSYYGITSAQFTQGLGEVLTNDFAPPANMQYFREGASGHVLWFEPQLSQGGVTVQQFVTEMVDDSASWTSVHP